MFFVTNQGAGSKQRFIWCECNPAQISVCYKQQQLIGLFARVLTLPCNVGFKVLNIDNKDVIFKVFTKFLHNLTFISKTILYLITFSLLWLEFIKVYFHKLCFRYSADERIHLLNPYKMVLKKITMCIMVYWNLICFKLYESKRKSMKLIYHSDASFVHGKEIYESVRCCFNKIRNCILLLLYFLII